MKNLVIFSLLIVLAFTMIRCSDDEGSSNAIYNALGTVRISYDSTIVVLDNDQRLLVKNVNDLSATPKNGDRILVYFTIDSETDPHVDLIINIISWNQLIFKPVAKLTATNSDSLGTDPINISSIWIAHDYLNVNFSFYAFGSKHMFSLARVMSDTRTDTITLEIRHNAAKDALTNEYSGIMTFDLTSLRSTTADSVVLDIKAKQYNNQSYQGFYTYKY